MKKNPKKIITHCPLKKEKGSFVKSECPAIGNVRNIRKQLNTEERTGTASEESLGKLRAALKKAKTEDTKEGFCKTCVHRG
jgi:hypothetical protein